MNPHGNYAYYGNLSGPPAVPGTVHVVANVTLTPVSTPQPDGTYFCVLHFHSDPSRENNVPPQQQLSNLIAMGYVRVQRRAATLYDVDVTTLTQYVRPYPAAYYPHLHQPFYLMQDYQPWNYMPNNMECSPVPPQSPIVSNIPQNQQQTPQVSSPDLRTQVILPATYRPTSGFVQGQGNFERVSQELVHAQQQMPEQSYNCYRGRGRIAQVNNYQYAARPATLLPPTFDFTQSRGQLSMPNVRSSQRMMQPRVPATFGQQFPQNAQLQNQERQRELPQAPRQQSYRSATPYPCCNYRKKAPGNQQSMHQETFSNVAPPSETWGTPSRLRPRCPKQAVAPPKPTPRPQKPQRGRAPAVDNTKRGRHPSPNLEEDSSD